jgi:hypothetical protein
VSACPMTLDRHRVRHAAGQHEDRRAVAERLERPPPQTRGPSRTVATQSNAHNDRINADGGSIPLTRQRRQGVRSSRSGPCQVEGLPPTTGTTPTHVADDGSVREISTSPRSGRWFPRPFGGRPDQRSARGVA